jgi:hypothetical protein
VIWELNQKLYIDYRNKLQSLNKAVKHEAMQSEETYDAGMREVRVQVAD